MKVQSLVVLLSSTALLTLPAAAQTARKNHQLPPALQKKVAERTLALRANAATPSGPLFDTVARTWTIEAADCKLVKSQVKLTGVKGHTVWLTMNDDGTFHLQIRTEASGTAVDADGNKYVWIYSSLANLNTPDPNADTPIILGGYGPATFQLAPLTSDGVSYTAIGHLQVDTPTPINGDLPITANTPLGCEPI